MSSSSTALPIPEGPGSVSGAPHLPEGFTGTFTSRYIDTGDVRLHAVVGAEFSASAGTNKLPDYAVRYYVPGPHATAV